MSRFRLRFLLQEFDLPVGEVVLGRSPDCHVTIEDPLISRQHAKIVVTETASTFVDLGSRNGSRVNGRIVTAPHALADADRIRIGAQELVYFELGIERRASRQTGAMLFCGKCGTPFPEGAAVCPHCGAPPSTTRRDDETMSGSHEPRRTWMLQLMGEVLERALRSDKVNEAERILQRAVDEFNDRLAQGETVEHSQLGLIADYALRVATRKADVRWALWVIDAYRSLAYLPTPEVAALLVKAETVLPGLGAALAAWAGDWHTEHSVMEAPEADVVAQFERLAPIG